MPRVEDPEIVRRILNVDRAWSVFALADLREPYSGHAEWLVSGDALVLVYRAFHIPVLFASGPSRELGPLLAEVAEPRFYISVRAGMADLLREAGYRIEGERRMLRMVLEGGAPDVPGEVFRIAPRDLQGLEALYAEREGWAFFVPDMLAHGVYHGVREGTAWVAAAGTHVVSPEEGVAAIGNVYTREDRRNLGLARRTTAAVAHELRRMGIETIALNVEAGNAAAVRVYERLGFRRHCEYREGVASHSALV